MNDEEKYATATRARRTELLARLDKIIDFLQYFMVSKSEMVYDLEAIRDEIGNLFYK